MEKDQSVFLIFFSFIGDIIFIASSLICAHWVRFKSGFIPFNESWWTSGGGQKFIPLSSYTSLVVVGTVLLLCAFFISNLYAYNVLLRLRSTTLIVTRGVALWFVVYLGLSLAVHFNPPVSRIYAVLSAILAWLSVLIWRFLYVRLIKAFGLDSCLTERVAFFGWSDAAHRLVESLQRDIGNLYSIAGVVLDAPMSATSIPKTLLPILGDSSNLAEILRNQRISILVQSDGVANVEHLIAMSNLCDREMVQFKMIPTRLHSMIAGLHLDTISDVPVLGVVDGPLVRPLNQIVKRLVDIIGSLVGLTISVPIIFIFGALVYLESPGPIIYRQTRIGRRGKNFQILKIRSMRIDAEVQGGAQWAKKNDDRRLKIGEIMRATNIDEVPQFWNVLKGDMSLVGPRPERPELISRFQYEIPHYNARHRVKPGMTGWAQVNGLRGDTDLIERIRYDLYYIEKWTFLGDFWIMLKTFNSRKNAY
jgi:exopolysaccharide biosynthesis polyprenyl glycosylphosphotransferase